MRFVPYTEDVYHCLGARQRICTRCFRSILLRKWKAMPNAEKGTIIVTPPKYDGRGCPCFYDVRKIDPGFYDRN